MIRKIKGYGVQTEPLNNLKIYLDKKGVDIKIQIAASVANPLKLKAVYLNKKGDKSTGWLLCYVHQIIDFDLATGILETQTGKIRL